MADEEKKSPKGKKGGLDKYKWWIVGGGGMLLIVVFLAVKKSNTNANAASAAQGTTTPPGTDPATGYLQGSPADLAALGSGGSSEGIPGPQGPPGPPGPPGGTTQGTPVAYPQNVGPMRGPYMPIPGQNNNQVTYTVRPGDNLVNIAQRLGSSPVGIMQANRGVISGTNVVHPGQRIIIP